MDHRIVRLLALGLALAALAAPVVGNHGDMGTKADLSEARQFLEDLSAAVSSAIAAAQSVEEMQKTIRLERYSGWMNFEQQLPGVIQSAYLNLTQYSGR